MRTSASLLLLTLALVGFGCGGRGRSASTKHARLETLGYHTRCPSTDRLHEASPDPRTASVLVPVGPTSALICRYWGSKDSGREGTFAGARSVTDSAAFKRGVGRLDALPTLPRLPFTCPVFGDRSVLILFHYRHASDDPVRIRVYCRIPVSNGRIVTSGEGLGEVGEAHWVDEALL